MSQLHSHYVNGRWVPGEGLPLTSTDPATGGENWSGRAASTADVDAAVGAARTAFEGWAATPAADRVARLGTLAAEYRKRTADLADAICRETGKPRWEAVAEVEAMIAKVAISVEAFGRRTGESASTTDGVTAATRYKPHGVLAILGPFNIPGHLPNGHLVPALLAGNTIVFKPSEQTPLVGERMAQAAEAAGLPPGVFNLVQGGAQTGTDLSRHPEIDGILFTGSATVGLALSRQMADRPDKILALEMGGNNPLVFHDCSAIDAAVSVIAQSAYLSAGQRCSCSRRLIVTEGEQGEALLDRLATFVGKIRVGFHTDVPEPFMGPVITAHAANSLLEAQSDWIGRGGRSLVQMQPSARSAALLSPGLIDVTGVSPRDDVEVFGPLLQVIRVPTFEAAVREANHTRYGLAAGLLSDRRECYEAFYRRSRAGVVNWNRPLTGASSRLPFGGVGLSGNHHPSAYFAADYCSYPVGSLEADRLSLPTRPIPGLPS